MTTETTERYYAEMEAARIHADDEYFRARPNLQRNIREEKLFQDGFERAFKLLWRADQVRASALRMPSAGDYVTLDSGEFFVTCVRWPLQTTVRFDSTPEDINVTYCLTPAARATANSPRGEEPSSAPTSTPEARTAQERGTAGESPPFNCPVCGAHDYGLYAIAVGGCPHCMRAELERLRALVQEWACEKCNMVYPGPPQRGFACVTCPKCKGTTRPRASLEIDRLERQVATLRAALSAARAQWIHSVNAEQCLRALGEGAIRDSVGAPARLPGEAALARSSWDQVLANLRTGDPIAAAYVSYHYERLRQELAYALVNGNDAQMRRALGETMRRVYNRLQCADVPSGPWREEASQCLLMGSPPVPEDAEFDKALEAAMDDLGYDPRPLEVYDSNSYRRVGLKGRYHTVMRAAVHRDGQPDITPTPVLRALVAAFNAMLARRKS